ncbi:hypothetical protein [Candidatus Mesenet endosymbiont of Agriotes lineatus]|uniref:hypothetical protein n=1 Tax=Candidatus Mesenet endosymbiont of Agriotes lineatus TaxID=3077948 RepID=UPI0030CF081A
MSGVNYDIYTEQTLKLYGILADLPQYEKEYALQFLKETAQTPEIMDITGATKDQSSRYVNSGIERLTSNDVNKDDISNIAFKSADFVNSLEIQDKISRNKGGLSSLVNKFKTLSTKNKLLLGGGILAAALVTPLLPVVALVVLTVAVLGLGGMAIEKGTIKAGKAVAHGAQIVDNATAHEV